MTEPEGPRYGSAEELIALLTALQASAIGLTVEQIQERFDVSRKTVERRLNAIGKLFPGELHSDTYDGQKKHWRLRRPAVAGLVRLTHDELVALDSALERVERDGRADQAQSLRSLSEKVRTLAASVGRPGVETDAGALLEGEGLAMRPGPRPKIPLDTVAVLRDALLAMHEVRIEYRSHIKAETTQRVLRPYGFLFGARHYLIAHDASRDGVRMFRLSNIRSVEPSDVAFDPDPEFDLREYASTSFGVFQEKPHDVVLRFSPGVAGEASEYVFHPSQRLQPQEDGSLIVRFRAGGLWEMAFHLFSWRGDVEVVEPAELRETLVTMLKDSLLVHGGDS